MRARRAGRRASGRCRPRTPGRRRRPPPRSGSPSRSGATRARGPAGPDTRWSSRSRLSFHGFEVALPEVDEDRRALVGVGPQVARAEADRVHVLGILTLAAQIRVGEDERLVDDVDDALLPLRVGGNPY